MGHDRLSEEQRELRELVRRLTADKIAPRAAEIDESGEFPWDVVELFRENDILALPFPEAYGGTGTGSLMCLVAIEEISKVCATSGLILAVQSLGGIALELRGTEEQKERYLPPLASGEWLAAYALTEPGSGSDAAAMLTTARREGGAYVLNGSKRFITNAGVAGLYTVFAKTDPEAAHRGISCFVVEADTPGLEVGRIEPKMGIKGSTTGEVLPHRLPRPRREPRRARRARDSRSQCASSTARGPESPPRRWVSPRARPTMRSSTRARGRRWVARSESTSWSPPCSPTWRRRCEAGRGLLYSVGRMIDQGWTDRS